MGDYIIKRIEPNKAILEIQGIDFMVEWVQYGFSNIAPEIYVRKKCLLGMKWKHIYSGESAESYLYCQRTPKEIESISYNAILGGLKYLKDWGQDYYGINLW